MMTFVTDSGDDDSDDDDSVDDDSDDDDSGDDDSSAKKTRPVKGRFSNCRRLFKLLVKLMVY